MNVTEKKVEFMKVWNDKVRRPGSAELIDWLSNETDFFTAPASSRYHSAEEGGLCAHSLNVYYRLVELFKYEKIKNGEPAVLTPDEEESLAVIALLHDICKTNFYTVDWKNQKTYEPEKVAKASKWEIKHDSGGDFIWEKVPYYKIDDTRTYGHGECSVDLIRDFMKLSANEKLAIRWHMGFAGAEFKGGSGTVGDAFSKCPIAVLTHAADLFATYLDEA